MNELIKQIITWCAIGIPFIIIILYVWLKKYTPKNLEEIKPNLYISKNKKGEYSLKYPPVKDLNQPFSLSNANWKNLIAGGKWSNISKAIFILIIIVWSMFAWNHDMNYWIDNACDVCKIQNNNEVNQMKLNGSLSDISRTDLKDILGSINKSKDSLEIT